jgi:hypothetical protein
MTMSDLWHDLRFLIGPWDDKDWSAEEKLDLLARVVANLVDEVEILKQYAARESQLPYEEWLTRYRKERMWLLFSAQGGPPACVRKYRDYLQTRDQTAADLIPDPISRAKEIESLGQLT